MGVGRAVAEKFAAQHPGGFRLQERSAVTGDGRYAVTALSLVWRRWPELITIITLMVVSTGCRSDEPAPASYQTLQQIKVVKREIRDSSYRRAAFGHGWADLDGDGRNTRDEILLAAVDTSKPYRTQRQGRCRGDMVAGTWTDLYTGTVATWTNLKDPIQAQEIPIDHIVSLAGAYRYGAKTWTQQRRVEFANDQLNLTPTTAAINQAKTDKDPASWTPPPTGQCAYATRYIAVKVRYALPVDAEEQVALQLLLRGCPT